MSRKQKKVLIRIIIAAAFFIVGFFVPDKHYIRLVVYLASYALVGYDVIFGAFRDIFLGEVFGENLLMSIASVGAFFVGDYPEAVAVMLFFRVGEMFEETAVRKSRNSIKALMSIRPDRARKIVDNKEIICSPDEVKIGETVRVNPGERIPLDGSVVSGAAFVDTSALTGESQPISVKTGSVVHSGCVVTDSVIDVKTEKEYAQSAVARVLYLVQTAESKKAKTEKFITKFAKLYTPIVCIVALLVAVLPPLILSDSFSPWIHRALVFLVVSCPCALVISVPLGFFGGIGKASKSGILIKGSDCMENISKINTVCFDKTGTLTDGKLIVSKIQAENMNEAELLKIAASLESHSSHPIAKGITQKYNGEFFKVENTKEIAGGGVEGVINGKKYSAGTAALTLRIALNAVLPPVSSTAVFITENGSYAGVIELCDSVKENAKDTVELLRKSSIRTVMLTGDRKEAAERVKAEVGVDEALSGLLPSDKMTAIENEMSKGGVLAFVGDGINDAPALTRADVGFAMGALGSDAAIEAADVVIMNDNLKSIALASRISRKTLRTVKQNIIFALSVKAIILLISIAGFSFMMWLAVFADVGVSIIAILNSMKLLLSKK